MWSIHNKGEWCGDGTRETEDWIAAGATLPRPDAAFRQRVLEQACVTQRHSVSLHRIQMLTTSLLAFCGLLLLPSYYHSLQRQPQAARLMHTTAVVVPTAALDGSEWAFVESAIAMRHQSARTLRQVL